MGQAASQEQGLVGELVQFTLTEPKRAKEVEAPPKDPLERAHWVHSVLCEELFDVLNDRAVEWEYPLNTHAIRDFADGKRRVQATMHA